MRKLALILIVVIMLAVSSYNHPTNAASPTPAATASTSLTIDVGTPGFLGYIVTLITPATTPPSGQPPWGPVYLPNDSSASATIDFTINGTNGVLFPRDYTLLVNGRCIPPTQGSSTCSKPIRGSSFYCSMSGQFDISWQATGYSSVPKTILCVPPSQVPQ